MIAAGGILVGIFLGRGASVADNVDFVPVFISSLGMTGTEILAIGLAIRTIKKNAFRTIIM